MAVFCLWLSMAGQFSHFLCSALDPWPDCGCMATRRCAIRTKGTGWPCFAASSIESPLAGGAEWSNSALPTPLRVNLRGIAAPKSSVVQNCPTSASISTTRKFPSIRSSIPVHKWQRSPSIHGWVDHPHSVRRIHPVKIHGRSKLARHWRSPRPYQKSEKICPTPFCDTPLHILSNSDTCLDDHKASACHLGKRYKPTLTLSVP
jgi:hypothetical protein